jgi:Mrp family chromosome partitioning ATPase
MSSVTLNKPVPTERPFTSSQPASGLVRYPHANSLPSRRSALVKDSAFDNGIRSLYRQVTSFRSPDGKLIRTLGLTSCYQQEGKSTVAECLATVAAKSQRVLLVDANEPLASIHKGLRDVALTGVAVANDSASIGQSRHQTVPGEGANRQPAGSEMRDLLRLLLNKFDLIVLDLPTLDSTSVLDLAPLMDGVVLVIESERVRWRAAASGIELLESAGSQVLGTVVNKQRQYIPQWLYQRL